MATTQKGTYDFKTVSQIPYRTTTNVKKKPASLVLNGTIDLKIATITSGLETHLATAVRKYGVIKGLRH